MNNSVLDLYNTVNIMMEREKCLENRDNNFGLWSTKDFQNILSYLQDEKPARRRTESDLTKYKRSLKLVGIEPVDSGRSNLIPAAPSRTQSASTVTTRLNSRSVSLDQLRQEIRTAWTEDRLDHTHRKLLAQAVYEEWYFRKSGEIRENNRKENIKQAIKKGNIEQEVRLKEMKAKREHSFQKWLKNKERQTQMKKKQENESLTPVMNKKETMRKAFLDWKKIKDRDLANKMKEKQMEEERKLELERQKKEKKRVAEKVFEQWKCKLLKEIAIQKKKELEQRERQLRFSQKIEEEKKKDCSYLNWKASKDKEIKEEIKNKRELDKLAKREQEVMLQKRLLQAQQAFENWLKKLDNKKKNGSSKGSTRCKHLRPWIPP
ncbi:hypothetical protein RUM43_008012 [Polyplax serrata]|uniref:Uncharacterized protein n=1 Tax=Polyplax serrata TaxID=468196 RepID=A0AAN8S872_POLSC